MSFPRLVQKFGKTHSWKMMLNPRTNLNERVNAVVGECNKAARETYHKGWKRSLRNRVKPERQKASSTETRKSVKAEPGVSFCDPSLLSVSKKVASCLSKVRTPQLSDLVTVGEVVGSGVEGVVRPGVRRKCEESTENYVSLSDKIKDYLLAVKTVEKGVGDSGYSCANECKEVKVLSHLATFEQHPNVTHYFHTFESPVRFHIVTEFNRGGDLFSYLCDRDFECQSEETTARVLMQILCGVLFSHERGFVHLDLKLENIMRREEGEEIDAGGVCIVDFGHASRCPREGESVKLTRPVGSPSYAAPEVVLKKEYSCKSDAWSLGVMMYILLQGYLPFPHLQQKKWREFSVNDYGNFDKEIAEHDPFYYEGDWEEISEEARDLCQKLLQVDSESRISVQDAINHSFFARNGVKMVRNKNGLPLTEVCKVEESAVNGIFSGFM